MNTLQNLKEAYKTLDQERIRKKAMDKQVKEECSHSQRYNEIAEEMKKLREERKMIKESVIDDLQIRGDLEESTLEIKDQKEIIAALTIELIQKGGFNPYDEIEIDDLVIKPKVSVSYSSKQLSMF